MYSTEQQLVDRFVASLQSSSNTWGSLKIATEFYYLRGCTDIIAVNSSGKIIAFEVKLERWKEALHQAYRNSCFAHFSYIVLPEKTAKRALKRADEFYKLSIGICYLSDEGQIVVPIEAPQSAPLQNWLTLRAIKLVSENYSNARTKQSIRHCESHM